MRRCLVVFAAAALTLAGCVRTIGWATPDRVAEARQTVLVLGIGSSVVGSCVRIRQGCLTAAHVLERIRQANPAVEVVAESPELDLAVLASDSGGRLAKLGPTPVVGEPVFSVWIPYGIPLVSGGVVAAVDVRGWKGVSDGSFVVGTWWVGPGVSGGGVFDRRGRLVGIAQSTPLLPWGPSETLVLAMPVSAWRVLWP